MWELIRESELQYNGKSRKLLTSKYVAISLYNYSVNTWQF